MGTSNDSHRLRGGIALGLGLACLGLDARWVGEAAGRGFVGRWYGLELFSWSAERARDLAARFAPGVATPTSGAFELSDPVVLAGWLVLLGAALAGALWFPRLVAGPSAAGQPRPAAGLLLAGALAAIFAVSPWLPHFLMRRTALSAPAYLGLRDLALGLGGTLVALGLYGLLARGRSEPGAEPTPDRSDPSATPSWIDGRASLLAATLLAVLAPLLASSHFLDGEPLTNDGVAYRFQAELFTEGQVVRDNTAFEQAFSARQILPGPRATSKYPPGHSLLLAPGAALGVARLIPLLLAGLSVLLTFHLARRLGGRSPGGAAWFFAASPMVLGVESLWLSHATSLPLGLLFLVAWLAAWDRAEEPDGASAWPLALAAGAVLSLAFAARPLTAVALAAPVALAGLVQLRNASARGLRLKLIGLALLGFLPGLFFFLAVNDAVTGSPFQTAYALYAERVSPNDRWGLVNLGTALPYTAYNLARLSAWLTGGAVGGLLLLFAWRHARPKRHAHLTWSLPLALLGAYSLHRFQGIPWVGPLYLVESLPVLAVLLGGGLVTLAQRIRLPLPLGLALLLASNIWLLLPHLQQARRESDLRRAPRTALEQHQPNSPRALILVPLEDPTAHKRHPLPPPSFSADPTTGLLIPARWPVFARDLDEPHNQELRTLLGNPPTYRWIPSTSQLQLIAPAAGFL